MAKNTNQEKTTAASVHLEKIQDAFRSAGEELRIEMFLHYRELREQFESIQKEEMV